MKEKVRIGVVGLSGRGMGLLCELIAMPDVVVPAVCDLYEDRKENGVKTVAEKAGYKAEGYHDYRELCARDDLDAVIVPASWNAHYEVCIAAMKAGKYVATEVGGAYSVNECWELVRTSEATGMPCSMLENACYSRHELALLNMVKQGIFGEIIHIQGGYEHDLREEVSCGRENRHYRFANYANRNGELYPTHELGPMCKYIGINRGNRLVSLTSMSSKARGLRDYILEKRGRDSDIADLEWTQGDIVTTMIKCAHGETMLLVHDTTLPRPYSRNGRLQGTRGLWMEDGDLVYIDGVSEPHTWDRFTETCQEKYEHPLWAEYQRGEVHAGHGGIDYLVLRGFVEAVKNGKQPPIDVYDAATWMAVSVLSEESVALGSAPVAVPDFTSGKWFDRKPPVPSKYSLDEICWDLF